jgi:hypothetical protein
LKDFNAIKGLDRRKEFSAPDRERDRTLEVLKKKDLNSTEIKRELWALAC